MSENILFGECRKKIWQFRELKNENLNYLESGLVYISTFISFRCGSTECGNGPSHLHINRASIRITHLCHK